MAKMTKAQARKRLAECKNKLTNVALEDSFPIQIFTKSMKMIKEIDKMIESLK